jgi:hypothetical protein
MQDSVNNVVRRRYILLGVSLMTNFIQDPRTLKFTSKDKFQPNEMLKTVIKKTRKISTSNLSKSGSQNRMIISNNFSVFKSQANNFN